MNRAHALSLTLVSLCSMTTLAMLPPGCKRDPGQPPVVSPNVVDSGVAVVSDVCTLIEGIDTSGAIASVCATVEEIAGVIAYVLTLRTSAPDASSCKNIPTTTFCATDAEVYRGITKFVLAKRAARLLIDGGVK